MRHGEAEVAANTDMQRALTDRGRAEIRQAGDQLKTRGFTFEGVMVSPYLRARQTASLMAKQSSGPPGERSAQISEMITPDRSPAEAVAAIDEAFP